MRGQLYSSRFSFGIPSVVSNTVSVEVSLFSSESVGFSNAATRKENHKLNHRRIIKVGKDL